ncbi:MAG TPA: hypothetical protein VH107_09295 [Lacipirellulaceae bacterium]|jgi:hypothetical protein|nr:hypothetical protein [Lacipirellulaceae bacterium]
MPPLPPLKIDPKYGCFPWWPENGNDWVHPEDVATARSIIPSGRIFRRDSGHGDYLRMQYGDVTLRVRRTLWQEIEPEGFEIGDWVEVLSCGLRNEPRTGIIREMLWDQRANVIRYMISDNNVPINEPYTRDDLRHVQPTDPLKRI